MNQAEKAHARNAVLAAVVQIKAIRGGWERLCLMLDQNDGIFRQQRLERIHHAAEVVHGIRRIKKHKVETVVRVLELRYGGLPIHQQQAAAQIEVEKPFPQEEELAEKSARLAELNAQLDVDEKSHEPEQDEEEQEDAPRRPSVLAALEEKSDKPEPVKPFRSYYDKDGDAR